MKSWGAAIEQLQLWSIRGAEQGAISPHANLRSCQKKKRLGSAVLRWAKKRKCSFSSSQEVPVQVVTQVHSVLTTCILASQTQRTCCQAVPACSSLTQTLLASRRMMSRRWKWRCWDWLLHEISHESSSKKAHWKDLEDGRMWLYSSSVAHCT